MKKWKSPQKFITGEDKPPYDYKVFDFDNQKKYLQGYYFVMTEDGWELIYRKSKENTWCHFPYFNYKPFLKITEKLTNDQGNIHKLNQQLLYAGSDLGEDGYFKIHK